jgi:hypothetical protein
LPFDSNKVQTAGNAFQIESGIDETLGWEAYKHYRERHEAQRRAHFQAQGAPPSLIGDSGDNPIAESAPMLDAQRSPAVILEKVDETGVHQFVRTTTGEVVEIYDSTPSCNAPARTTPVFVPPLRTLTTREIAAMGTGLSVADQCPSFGRR